MAMEAEFLKQISLQFAGGFGRIEHAVQQLDDGQIWYRPSPVSNSVGIILQHLRGNLSQWVLEAVGGHAYKRNRPQEFEETHRLSKDEFLKTFANLKQSVHESIARLPPESVLASRRIQGFDETVLSALLSALTHLELHAGQIAYIAKLLLNESYEDCWKPATSEQGKR